MKGNGAPASSPPPPQTPEPDETRYRRWVPLVTCLLISVGITLLLLTLRQFGLLQYAELQAYDRCVTWRTTDALMSGRVTVIGITEDDITPGGVSHPIEDGQLAEILHKVFDCEPHVVGLDIVRDRKVGDDAGHDALRQLAEAQPLIFPVVGDGKGGYVVKAPAWLPAEQSAAVNFTPDLDGVVRRGTIFVGSGQAATTGYPSMAHFLAAVYLERERVGQPRPTERNDWVYGNTVVPRFRPDNGAYVPAKTEVGGIEFLMDFKIPGPQTFRRLTARQMLAGKFSPEDFRGKVVLVGMTAPDSIKDFINSPKHLSHERGSKWFGVDVHAAAVEQLLRHALKGARPTRFWTDWGEAAWTLGWAVLGGALGFLFRSPWKLLPCVVAGAALLGVVDYFAFLGDWWLPFVPPLLAWTACSFAVTSYVTALERAERQVVMKLFGDHVSPEVAQWIWDNREAFFEGRKIRSREITATLLFTDLKNFTRLSENMTADQVMVWLNDLMDVLSDCVGANKGFLNKYMGDSIMAVFGAPVPSKTEEEFSRDAQNAVRCALCMRRALAKLNARWARDGLPLIGMRVGIFTGPVIAGSMGKAGARGRTGRLEYTVIGDTVNTASRLESFDKDLMEGDIAADNCRILIGAPTLDLLGGRFRTRYIGTEGLKGKGGKVAIHGVIGEAEPAGVATAAAAAPASTSSP